MWVHSSGGGLSSFMPWCGCQYGSKMHDREPAVRNGRLHLHLERSIENILILTVRLTWLRFTACSSDPLLVSCLVVPALCAAVAYLHWTHHIYTNQWISHQILTYPRNQTGPTPNATSTSPSVESPPDVSSWSLELMLFPRLLRTLGPFVLVRIIVFFFVSWCYVMIASTSCCEAMIRWWLR